MVKTISVSIIWILLLTALPAAAGEMSVTEWERFNAETAAVLADYTRQVSAGEMPPIKCGTAIINELQSSRPKDAISKAAFTDREDTMSFTHGTEHFLLHYTNNGSNEIYQFDSQTVSPGVPDFIYESGLALEDVYQWEVGHLGFDPPPFDSGVDGRMDVYFIDFFAYGATVRDEVLPTLPLTATSYMFVENDYDGFPGYESNPIKAVRVTVAHEFFHTIQFGIDITEIESSGPTQNPAWIEMSATYMEEEVYSYVNDYYNYVPFYYAYPHWSLRTGTIATSPEVNNLRNLHMYGAVVWPIFLVEKFGSGIIKDIWDGCGETAGPNWWQATDEAIIAASGGTTNMREMFREFTLWNLFTDIWADTVNYFPEAKYYRLPQFIYPVSVYPATITPFDSLKLDSLYPDNLGANYILLKDMVGGIAISFNPDRTQPWGLQVVKFFGGINDSIEIDPVVYDSSTAQIILPDADQYEQVVLIPSVLGGNQLRVDYTINVTPLIEGVSRPNGGERLYVGAPYLITWFFADSVTTVQIELSTDSGSSWTEIAVTENDFFYDWTIPDTPSGNCLIRVTNVDNLSQFDVSDVVFSISSAGDNAIAEPYPNPAWVQNNDGVVFKAVLATGQSSGDEELSVYIMTAAGEKIREMHKAASIGETTVMWDFSNNEGETVAAGVYLAVIKFAGQTEVKKFVVLR